MARVSDGCKIIVSDGCKIITIIKFRKATANSVNKCTRRAEQGIYILPDSCIGPDNVVVAFNTGKSSL